MKKLNDLEYLKLGKFDAFVYDLKLFLLAIPVWLKAICVKFLGLVKDCGTAVKDEFVDILTTFTKGNWAVKLSFLLFGFGNLYYGQIMRGLFFLLFEAIFIGYMLVPSGGLYWMSKVNWFKTGATIGTVQGGFVETVTEAYGLKIVTQDWVAGDDSVKVLLYGLLSVIFVVAFICLTGNENIFEMNIRNPTITSRTRNVSTARAILAVSAFSIITSTE